MCLFQIVCFRLDSIVCGVERNHLFTHFKCTSFDVVMMIKLELSYGTDFYGKYAKKFTTETTQMFNRNKKKTPPRSASKQIIIATFVISLWFFSMERNSYHFSYIFLFVRQVGLVVNWVHLLYLKSCSFYLKCLCGKSQGIRKRKHFY